MGEGLQVDRRDGGDHHDVEHEACDAILHEGVGVFLFNHAFLLQAAEDGLHEQRENGREEEVEAPDKRPQGVIAEVPERAGLNDRIHAPHEQVGQGIRAEDQCKLYREFVHGFGQADLALAGNRLEREVLLFIQ